MSFDTGTIDQTVQPNKDEPTMNPTPADTPKVLFQIGDRVYHTAEEAANKIQNADKHIANIEAENAANLKTIQELTSKLGTDSKVNDLLDKLSQSKNEGQTAPASTPDLDAKQIVAQVRSELKSEDKESERQSNMDESMSAAQKALGDSFKSIIKAKAVTLGMSIQDVDVMASNNPSVFATLFMSATGVAAPAVNSSTVNTSDLNIQEPPKTKFTKIRGVKARSDEVRRRMALKE